MLTERRHVRESAILHPTLRVTHDHITPGEHYGLSFYPWEALESGRERSPTGLKMDLKHGDSVRSLEELH
jgi:hypothetical protein